MISVFTALAHDGGKKNRAQKTWAATAVFTSITIQGNLDVFLVESAGSVVRVEGYEKAVNEVSFSVEEGRSIVKSKESFISGKATIYIPVRHLQQLTVKGNVRLSSIGHLESPKINIRIAADCHLNIVSTGKIDVVSDEENGYYFSTESRKSSVF